MAQAKKRPRKRWLQHKNDIKKAIGNQCPHCGDRNNSHLRTTINTKEGEINVRICTVCKKKYQKIGEN